MLSIVTLPPAPWQRPLDLVITISLLPLAFPLIVLLALIVRLDSPGPAFFRQERLGRGGRSFVLFKLRSMRAGADEALHRRRVTGLLRPEGRGLPWQAPAHDPRVTRLGRLMRLSAVDELPQLVNVLKGEMSLVGPRPMTQWDVDRLSAISTEFARRLEVRPGITGLPQVTQARGAHLTAALDAQYARERSVWMDLGILCRTAYINVVGKTRGARRLAA